MITIWIPRIAASLAVFLLPGLSAQGEKGPLPKFTFKGVALHPKDLTWAPTGELERSSIIKMEGRVSNPLGKYYLYYSPHKHVGIGLVYSDSIEGPWTEYKGNPIIEAAAIPDVHWIEETGKFHLWVQETTPLVEPIEGENNDIYGPSLLQWKGKHYIVYQDHTGYRGGLVKYVELDGQLQPVGDQGQRYVLIDPVPDSPIDNRYRGGKFYREGDKLYLYSGGGENPRIIVYATAETEED